MSRSYLDLSKDEEEHALSLHKESFVIDASLVPFIEGVGENIWIDDVLEGGVTAGNATVCMGRSFSGALRELAHYREWTKGKADKVLIVKKASDIEKAKKEGKHLPGVQRPHRKTPQAFLWQNLRRQNKTRFG